MLLRNMGDQTYDLLETILKELDIDADIEVFKEAIRSDKLDGVHSGDLYLTTKFDVRNYMKENNG